MTEHKLTPLCELAAKYGTDKGGWHLKAGDTCHNYTPTYHSLFKDQRKQVKGVLEIGIGNGASLRMWRDYFPEAVIFGIDNDVNRLIEEDRIVSIHADQNDAAALAKILLSYDEPPFDLIIDDGSHIAEHQISCANALLPYLHDYGIYVVEDIHYDCRPETILDHIEQGHWNIHSTGIGLGRARCECGCGAGEVLLVGSP